MEYPESCLTNVLKIDYLSQIPYHVYVPTNRRPNPTHEGFTGTPGIQRSNTIALRRGEKHIREQGILGISDIANGELWIFDIGIDNSTSGNGIEINHDLVMTGVESGGSHEPLQKQRVVEFPPQWGLRESREGVFRASFLGELDKSTSGDDPPGSFNNPTDLTGEKPKENPPLPPIIHQDSPRLIYKYFIASALAMVSYAISKSSSEEKRWIPLNITTLIQIQQRYTPISTSPTTHSFSLPTPPSSARIHTSGRADIPGGGGLTMFSLSGYFTSSGTLCIVPTGRKVGGLDSLTSLSKSVDDSSQVSNIIGRDVWIAPWGRVGRVQEFVSSVSKTRTAMTADEARWACEVREYLLDRGIILRAEDEEWVRLEVWLADKEGDDRLQSIVWPVVLCFIKLHEGDSHLHLVQSEAPQSIPMGLAKGEAGLEVSLGVTGNIKDEQVPEKNTVGRVLFEDQEYFALSGLTLSQDEGSSPDPGVTWFSASVMDPVGFAEKWKMSADHRKQAITLRREEREKEKRQIAQNEALKRQAEELRDKEKEVSREMDEIKKEAAATASTATVGSTTGVYSTPPDGQLPTGTSSTVGFQEPLPADSTSAVPLDTTLTVSNDMDLDWAGTGDPMSLDDGDVAKVGATDGLAGIAELLGDDLVDGDDDIFAGEVTDKDFDFFDEPDFGDTLDGGMGLTNMHHDGGIVGTSTIGGTTVPSLAVPDMMDISNTPGQMSSLQNLDYGDMDRVSGTTELGMHITTPATLSMDNPPLATSVSDDNIMHGVDNRAQIAKHTQTPPLSPHRAMKLLLPQYIKTHNERSVPSAPPKPSTSSSPFYAHPDDDKSSNTRRQSIYSPLIFLPGVEMADKKYMEGGRFFGPPPKEEKLEVLDGKLASISLLDSPLKRRLSHRKPLSPLVVNIHRDSVHHGQRSESAVEDADPQDDGEDDSDDSEYEFYEDESSESDVDEESETDYSIPPLADSSPMYIGVNKRKRALDDDGDLDVTESGREAGIATPLQPGQYDSGDSNPVANDLAPPPWKSMIPDPEDYCLVDIFEKLSMHDIMSNDFSALSRMSEPEYNSVSKVLASQIATGSLLQSRGWGNVDSTVFEEDNDEGNLMKRRWVTGENQVEEVVKGMFGGATRCTVETYSTIHDAAAETAPSSGRVAPRPLPQQRRAGKDPTPRSIAPIGDSASSDAIFKIPPSHVHVHRAETALEILPVALKFWETFGLGPCSGPKNVIGFCIYPAGEAMTDAVDEFMERVGAVYDSCRLGSYVRGTVDDIAGGMMGVQLPLRHIGESDMGSIMQSIKDACIRLGAMLANVADELQNIVIYLVNPFSKASALPHLCHAFCLLNHTYLPAVAQLAGYPNNVVLQIVPIDFITARNGLSTPSQADYIRFCLEVYDRCMITESPPSGEEVRNDKVSLFPSSSSSSSSSKMSMTKVPLPMISSIRKLRERGWIYSPSVILAKPVPKSINFEVSAEPVNPLLQEGSCLHVAYKQSLDERWVVFAWTDNYGEFQQMETYSLGRKGSNALRPWEDVAREAWRKTLEYIRRKSMSYRVCLAKAGGWVDADEVNLWNTLSTEYPQPNITNTQPGPSYQPPKNQSSTPMVLTILIADSSPALSLIPALPSIAPLSFNSHSSLFTPVSTPNASMLSPDPSGSTSAINTGSGTPNADAIPDLDPDAQLVDSADEVWGVILRHKLPISPIVTDLRYSLASGYLVKRGASGVEGGEDPVVMGVSLVGISGGNANTTVGQGRKQMIEGTLKEVLCQWRGLSTLAQHKGVSREKGGRGSVLPWHVAVVEKAVNGLEMCM